MNRREFLRSSLSTVALAGARGLVAPAFGQEGAKSRVVVVRNTGLATETKDAAINRMLAEMVHESVRLLVGGNVTRQEAWARFFGPQDIVGIKVNCIAPPMVPHPAIVEAIAEGVGFCGVPRRNVIVFDKEDRDLIHSGYTINVGGNDIQCYGTVGPHSPGYEERQSYRRDTAYKLSRIVSRQCKKLVNVPVIKDHCWAGITCALKNHFGCIDNPNAFHKVNHCCPAIIDVCYDPNIRRKQQLVICDARGIQYDGGPSFHPESIRPYCAVITATDAVALDTVAIQLVDMCRESVGLGKLADREAPPIHVAEGAKQGLGTNDMSRIEIVAKELGPLAGGQG